MRSSILIILLLITSSFSYAKGIPGIEGPFVDLVDDKIIVTLELPNLELQGGLELLIPRSINSTASLGPNVLAGGSLFTMKIDKEDIKNALNVDVGDAQALPCGRPLPGVPGGQLKNAIRIDLPKDKYNLSFYFHEKIFGAYVPFNFDFPVVQSFSVILKYKGKNIGSLLIVNKDGEKKAAGVIFLRIDDIKENTALLNDMDIKNTRITL